VGERALAVAERYLGTPYVYGGASPGTGFDSSGLTQYSYGEVGVSLPRIADDQCRAGNAAPTSALELGDILCFGDSSGYIDHVGLYAGEGNFIHAPHTGDVVKYSSLSEPYYAGRLRGARRLSG
jgi:peptidoglycan DL-endopeptidase CwlO